MTTRRWLVAIPLAVVALLLQSAFWVPTYETQSAANVARLTTYIDLGVADAQILNPILSADGASSQVNQHVFDGLIDVDEELRWRGSLAESWDTTEEAYLAVLPGRTLPDGAPATASLVASRIRAALAGGALADLAADVQAVEVVPAESRELEVSIVETNESGEPVERQVPARIDAPERVKLALARVVSDLFERLRPVVGEALLAQQGAEAHIHPQDDADERDRAALLAKSAELLPVAEHNPVLTFALRRDVRFHDGHPFDSADVKFTYEAIMDPKNASPRTSSYEPVKRLELPDDHTVRVVYRRLYSPANTAWAMGMLPEHLMNDAALAREAERRGLDEGARARFSLRQSETAQHPIGTGPFRFATWERDEYVELERNEAYWGGPPEMERIFLRVVPDQVTQEVEFRAGAADSYTAQPHQAARYRVDPRYQTISTPLNNYTWIGYNLRRPLFQDPRVRRALAMAIDVDQVIEHVLYGEGQRVSGPYYVNTPYYDRDTPLVPYDPEGAKRLLAEAGFRPGKDGILARNGERLAFKLTTNNGNPQRKAIMTVAQDAWRKIGVAVVTQAFEWTVFVEQVLNGQDFDAIVLGWGGGGLDPDIYQIWHSSQTGPFQLNAIGYESAEADALIEAIRVEYDEARQIELAHRLHLRIAEDQPYTFLYAPRATYVLERRLVIVDRDETGSERHRRIEALNGRIAFFFTSWRKLAHDPVFDEES
jgi:ABC-type transport system substrate-binding protein